MNNEKVHWTKKELQIYILLLCANADSVQTEDELNLIRSKVDKDIFDRMYEEFQGDSEDESLEKIQDTVAVHHYSHRELSQLKREMQEIFMTDSKLTLME